MEPTINLRGSAVSVRLGRAAWPTGDEKFNWYLVRLCITSTFSEMNALADGTSVLAKTWKSASAGGSLKHIAEIN